MAGSFKVTQLEGHEITVGEDLLAKAGDSGKSLKARLDEDPHFPKYVERTQGKCAFSFQLSDLWSDPEDYYLLLPLEQGTLRMTVFGERVVDISICNRSQS